MSKKYWFHKRKVSKAHVQRLGIDRSRRGTLLMKDYKMQHNTAGGKKGKPEYRKT